MTYPTRLDFFQIGVGVAVERGKLRPPNQRLTRAAVETPGSDINIVTATASFMADEAARAAASRQKAMFLFSAEGDDLDRLVADRYSPDIVRKQAGPSVVIEKFTRSAGALPAVALSQGTKIRTTTGVEFELTAPVSFPPGTNGPFYGTMRATVPGLAGNVGAGTLTSFLQTPGSPGVTDSNIIGTNEEPAAGGVNKESDDSLRSRAVNFYIAARRGTVGAIEYGATLVNGVSFATCVEELDLEGDPTGRLYLYIADPNGQANAALASAVKQQLLEFRGAGIPVDVFASVPYFVDIKYRLGFASNVDPTAAFAQVQLATVFAVNSLRPKQTLQRSLLISVARTVPGVIVNDDAVVVPAGDLVAVGNQTFRTSAARVTNTI
jgi:hypothetical protein